MPRDVYVDETALLIGNVELHDGVSIWPYAVLRGDQGGRIVVGENSNVQDHVVLHTAEEHPTMIGKDCTIGHGAIINGAVIGDRCIIGMNSSVLDGAVIGDDCIVGANAVITGLSVIPSRSVVVGVPGRIIRSDDQNNRARALESSMAYQRLRDEHLSGRYARRRGP
ncbi:MAG: gamma carbonic anhydrase family protein [Methanomassiliicoccales archaeon]|jgi:carbonic anhydrase/acetyltransferase-like protein (isoleucine patch superfamily)|nr:gamma carbonic anhydrase family protein [Methanomassiliicoccales archaeon]